MIKNIGSKKQEIKERTRIVELAPRWLSSSGLLRVSFSSLSLPAAPCSRTKSGARHTGHVLSSSSKNDETPLSCNFLSLYLSVRLRLGGQFQRLEVLKSRRAPSICAMTVFCAVVMCRAFDAVPFVQEFHDI